MVKEAITTEKNQTIHLEYDKEKYNIEYVKSKNAIILRRLWDNTVLEIFNDNVGFIVQSDVFGETNFVVTDHSEKENVWFKHFIDRKYSDKLILRNKFTCDSVHLEECRITDSSFIVEQCGYAASEYNLDKTWRRFDRIYNDKKISKIVGEGILMVSEKKRAFVNSDVEDTITYGINPETYEIVTPIWSEMQQRYISVYTTNQMDKIKEKLAKEHKLIDTENVSLSDITIHFEIENYLNVVAYHFERNDTIYLDGFDSKVNEDFVKKFIRQ